MVKKAKELAEAHGYFMTLQFDNEANPNYHMNTTGTRRDALRIRMSQSHT